MEGTGGNKDLKWNKDSHKLNGTFERFSAEFIDDKIYIKA